MKYLKFIIILLLSLFVLRLNIKLHSEQYTREEQKDDIIHQLNFLESELKDNNLGLRMQSVFPEGFVFVNALYGLAWCELSLADREDKELKKRALNEALYAYKNLDSELARWTFPNDISLEYGVFYNGWRNYLLSKILYVDTTFEDSEKYISKFMLQSDMILRALFQSESPYLESYKGHSWPADMCVAMASLSNYDKIYGPKYQQPINDWINAIEQRLDIQTHLVPHKVNSLTGESIQGSRGCSVGLSLRMLAEIDSAFAHRQYQLYDSLFVDKTVGLPSIREYPKGTKGFGDIDSGPVIFGIGFSATIVMIGTFALYNDYELAIQQYKTINAFGICKKGKNKKEYLRGRLPMADAFIAWGRATALNHSKETEKSKNEWWGMTFHFISLLLILSLWALCYSKTIISKLKH